MIYPRNTEIDQRSSGMDPLSQTIALLRPRALLWKQLDARGDWAVSFPGATGVAFSLVAQGSCVFQSSGREPQPLSEGDFLLQSEPQAWSLGRAVGTPSVVYDHARVQTGGEINYLHRDAPGPVTRIYGGRFVFEDAQADLSEGLFPPIVVVRAVDDGAARLRSVLDLLGDEAAADRPGRSLLLERLLEVMLIQALRHASSGSVAGRQTLLAGLADTRIAAALAAVHGDVFSRWSVAKLAAIAGMSRSAFAERFSRVVGVAPMDYLLRWRMALAKDALQFDGMRLVDVALRYGYSSVSAFSTAFTRTVGCPPSHYARRRAQRQG